MNKIYMKNRCEENYGVQDISILHDEIDWDENISDKECAKNCSSEMYEMVGIERSVTTLEKIKSMCDGESKLWSLEEIIEIIDQDQYLYGTEKEIYKKKATECRNLHNQ